MTDEEAKKIQEYLPQGGFDPPRYDIHRDLERLLAERTILREAITRTLVGEETGENLMQASNMKKALRNADEA